MTLNEAPRSAQIPLQERKSLLVLLIALGLVSATLRQSKFLSFRVTLSSVDCGLETLTTTLQLFRYLDDRLTYHGLDLLSVARAPKAGLNAHHTLRF
ncbi:hypothetical protein DFH07DRAFT_860137 [Mycena maculata]|uniref:Uncharacterized protein n=1 Tax=Mycena maculata TaxID=230809 RepID=A0AAD7MI69_9AGAR|nr:hypothetical protein DFH07DRAFT_860137 [Mycena maculata]